jgi:hypothetical protein
MWKYVSKATPPPHPHTFLLYTWWLCMKAWESACPKRDTIAQKMSQLIHVSECWKILSSMPRSAHVFSTWYTSVWIFQRNLFFRPAHAPRGHFLPIWGGGATRRKVWCKGQRMREDHPAGWPRTVNRMRIISTTMHCINLRLLPYLPSTNE